jgi:hypothetical protein
MLTDWLTDWLTDLITYILTLTDIAQWSVPPVFSARTETHSLHSDSATEQIRMNGVLWNVLSQWCTFSYWSKEIEFFRWLLAVGDISSLPYGFSEFLCCGNFAVLLGDCVCGTESGRGIGNGCLWHVIPKEFQRLVCGIAGKSLCMLWWIIWLLYETAMPTGTVRKRVSFFTCRRESFNIHTMMLLTCTQEAAGSKLSRDTGHTDEVSWISSASPGIFLSRSLNWTVTVSSPISFYFQSRCIVWVTESALKWKKK